MQKFEKFVAKGKCRQLPKDTVHNAKSRLQDGGRSLGCQTKSYPHMLPGYNFISIGCRSITQADCQRSQQRKDDLYCGKILVHRRFQARRTLSFPGLVMRICVFSMFRGWRNRGYHARSGTCGNKLHLCFDDMKQSMLYLLHCFLIP